MKLSIVVPVYNEAKTVAAVVERLRSLKWDVELELLIVNDGSSDGTRQALAPFENLPNISVHHSPVNLGKGASLRIGFAQATGDLVTVQDADLELDPGELPPLLEPIIRGDADVVYGSRFLQTSQRGSMANYIANRSLSLLTTALYGKHITDMETCYKVMRRDVLRALNLRAARFEIEPELTAQILKRGFRLIEMPITYRPRTVEQGKKLHWLDGWGAVTMLVRQRFQKA